ncbi:MAG TPA: RagB/SusD family nutrient uptake outer membrane protein [Sphingobacterium sp.]|nr:RagB/SusD family nutrient uptake outer membrane protein [Sphingobacterium sp.]
MKRILLYSMLVVALSSCERIIDIDPISNVGVGAFYRDYKEANTALTGCYNGMHAPLYNEWMMTELRSDLSLQGVANSSAAPRIEQNELDMFTLNADHLQVYNYWINTYRNIRAVNYLLNNMGVQYIDGNHQIQRNANMTETEWQHIVGEALFIRAYHYFNMVRLFGNIFMVTEPVNPNTSKLKNYDTKEDVYNLIIADLQRSIEFLPAIQHQNIPSDDLGRVTHWASRAMLAKVFLTLDKKNDALLELNEVISKSGHELTTSYSDVFSIGNEMSTEILFAVRYKAGGFGIGSPFANLFAPTGSGSAVVNNDGDGLNFPTHEAMTMYYTSHATNKDTRYAANLAIYSPTKPYVKKYVSPVMMRYDAENDFPVLRYADVLLMKAEALGYNGSNGESVQLINTIRERAGAVEYDRSSAFSAQFFTYPTTGTNSIDSESRFIDALLNERKLELAFENQRFFDLVRFGKAIETLKQHFENEYPEHYSRIVPEISLEDLKAKVTEQRLLLPIPLREITTNNELELEQNPGY